MLLNAAVDMSVGTAELQAQVESVLAALVKAAAVELTKLFESRYGAKPVDAGRGEDKARTDDTDAKRSVGVQVDDDVDPLVEICGTWIESFASYAFSRVIRSSEKHKRVVANVVKSFNIYRDAYVFPNYQNSSEYI